MLSYILGYIQSLSYGIRFSPFHAAFPSPPAESHAKSFARVSSVISQSHEHFNNIPFKNLYLFFIFVIFYIYYVYFIFIFFSFTTQRHTYDQNQCYTDDYRQKLPMNNSLFNKINPPLLNFRLLLCRETCVMRLHFRCCTHAQKRREA